MKGRDKRHYVIARREIPPYSTYIHTTSKMDGEVRAREAAVFQLNFSVLQRLLVSSHEACLAVAAEMFAKGLVPHGIIIELQVPGTKGVMSMLSALLGRIENEPDVFYTFLRALEADSYFTDLAAKMRSNVKGETQSRTVETDGGSPRKNKLGEGAMGF